MWSDFSHSDNHFFSISSILMYKFGVDQPTRILHMSSNADYTDGRFTKDYSRERQREKLHNETNHKGQTVTVIKGCGQSGTGATCMRQNSKCAHIIFSLVSQKRKKAKILSFYDLI